jgi:hypothetical protein
MNLKEIARGLLEKVCLACDKDQSQAVLNSNGNLGSIKYWEYADCDY